MGYRSLAANTKFSIVHECVFSLPAYVCIVLFRRYCSKTNHAKPVCLFFCIKVGEVMFYPLFFASFENERESIGL